MLKSCVVGIIFAISLGYIVIAVIGQEADEEPLEVRDGEVEVSVENQLKAMYDVAKILLEKISPAGGLGLGSSDTGPDKTAPSPPMGLRVVGLNERTLPHDEVITRTAIGTIQLRGTGSPVDIMKVAHKAHEYLKYISSQYNIPEQIDPEKRLELKVKLKQLGTISPIYRIMESYRFKASAEYSSEIQNSFGQLGASSTNEENIRSQIVSTNNLGPLNDLIRCARTSGSIEAAINRLYQEKKEIEMLEDMLKQEYARLLHFILLQIGKEIKSLSPPGR